MLNTKPIKKESNNKQLSSEYYKQKEDSIHESNINLNKNNNINNNFNNNNFNDNINNFNDNYNMNIDNNFDKFNNDSYKLKLDDDIVENKLLGGTQNRVEFNDDNNSYIIYNNSGIECVISNDDILKNMIDNNNMYIKKYLYTLSYNHILEVNEFNFINSIFTSNLDIIVKLQNFIYNTINNSISENNENNQVLLFFYYQFIIWIFKNMSIYENNLNDPNKISKVFSTLTYRFSSLILKNIINIQNMCNMNLESLDHIISLKNDLLTKLDHSNKSSNETSSEIIGESSNETSSEIIGESSNEASSETISDSNNNSESNNVLNELNINKNILDHYKIINKDGQPIKNLKDLFSDNDSDNDNGYKEIDDTIVHSTGINEQNIKKLNEISELLKNSEINSYNKNSALKNGKLYEIKI